MKINGTLINYYFHCKRQCHLCGNRLNLEDNSEQVKIGKAMHEEKASEGKNTEISIDNIRLDKLTKEYLTEIKKSDADVEAARWQLLYYLKVLKEKGIVSTSLVDEPTRNELLACIDDCGNGVSEMRLTLETVRLLKSKGDAVAAQIKIVWRDAAQKYSDGPKGYLSMIGGLSNDPKRAKDLTDSITQTVAGNPSIKAVNSLVSYVAEAKQITDQFSLNPEIEDFLKKVSSQRATVLDLTPNVMTWLKEKNLNQKLKIRF